MSWISAGELDRRVSLQRSVITRDEFNAPVETWVEFANVWTGKRDQRGEKTLANGEVVAVLETRFKIRWSPTVADLSAKDRAVCEGATYDVSDVQEWGRRDALSFVGAKRND